MQLGLIGLGKMGGNMRERIRRAGHEVIGYDRNPAVSDVADLDGLVAALAAPRVVWVMVPSGAPTRDTVATLAEKLSPGDLSSTVATRASPMTSSTQSCWRRRGLVTSTAV